MNFQTKILQLEAPNYQKKDIIGSIAGIRPKRKYGERIEYEQIKNKHFFHNYGHGSWGMNLSYISAQKVIGIFEQKNQNLGFKNEPIAIIGSGVIGLMTAFQLLKKRYQVIIYSENRVNRQYKYKKETDQFMENNMIVSQVAGGMVWRMSFENTIFSQDELDENYDFFLSSYYNKSFKGIQQVRSILLQYEGKIKNSYKNPIQKGKIQFKGSQQQADCFYADNFVLDSSYLFDLNDQVEKLGAQFIQKKLNSQDQIQKEIPQRFIFNCSGISSYYLFEDKFLYPNKGQIILIQRSKYPLIDYNLVVDDENGLFYQLIHEDKILIGGIMIDHLWNNNIEERLNKQILEKLQNFLKKFQIKPKL